MAPVRSILKLNNPILFNDDVLTEILLRLPAKSLIRFKSVCKKWLSLISSDYFSHQHTLRCPKLQPSLILEGHWPDRKYFYCNRLSSMNGGEKVMIPYTLSVCHGYKIVQACNGLLLLLNSNKNSEGDSYRVYNPTTKLSTEINIPTYIARMALAFDPSKSPYYKIICIIHCLSSKLDDDDAYTCRIEVYDSESRSWKLISLGQFTIPSGIKSFEAQYYNNAIFWWRPYRIAYYCFDIAKNEMKAFSFPQSHVGVVLDSCLQELDGRLYCLRLAFESRHKLWAAVWELEGNDEWVLKHHHDLFTTLEEMGYHLFCETLGKCTKLMVHSDGGVQLICPDYVKMKMRAYSFLHKSFQDLVDFEAPPFDYKYHDGRAYCLKVFQFGETLALV